jgi:ACT domain-containing protein
MNRTVVTVSGKDGIGTIAKICMFFAENNINILDISQKSDNDRINMMMVVDITGYKGSFRELLDELNNIGNEIGQSIKAQHEEIFNMMHRI